MPEPIRLWIDESGDFADPDDVVLVAGVLTRRSIPSSVIRRGLSANAPGLPWPLHAAHYRLHVIWALASVTARRTDPTSAATAFDQASDRVVAFLSSHAADDVEAALGELESGRLPEWNHVDRLERLLESSRFSGGVSGGDFRRLTIARDRLVAAMFVVLSILEKQNVASAVAAAEASSGSAGLAWIARIASSAIQPSDTHRYFGLLRAVLEAGAAQAGAASTFRATVLRRGVHDVRLLTGEDIDRIIKGAGLQASYTLPSNAVRYDRHAGAPLVLADYVANTLRNLIRSHEPGSPEVGRLAAARVGMTTRFTWVGRP